MRFTGRKLDRTELKIVREAADWSRVRHPDLPWPEVWMHSAGSVVIVTNGRSYAVEWPTLAEAIAAAKDIIAPGNQDVAIARPRFKKGQDLRALAENATTRLSAIANTSLVPNSKGIRILSNVHTEWPGTFNPAEEESVADFTLFFGECLVRERLGEWKIDSRGEAMVSGPALGEVNIADLLLDGIDNRGQTLLQIWQSLQPACPSDLY